MRNNSGTLPEKWRGQTMFMYDYIKLIFSLLFLLCAFVTENWHSCKNVSVGEENRRAFLCVIIPLEAQGAHFSLCLYYVNCHQWKWEAYKTNTDHFRLFYNCFRTCPLLILLSAKFSKHHSVSKQSMHGGCVLQLCQLHRRSSLLQEDTLWKKCNTVSTNIYENVL